VSAQHDVGAGQGPRRAEPIQTTLCTPAPSLIMRRLSKSSRTWDTVWPKVEGGEPLDLDTHPASCLARSKSAQETATTMVHLRPSGTRCSGLGREHPVRLGPFPRVGLGPSRGKLSLSQCPSRLLV